MFHNQFVDHDKPPEIPDGVTISIELPTGEHPENLYYIITEVVRDGQTYGCRSYFDRIYTNQMFGGTENATRIHMAEQANRLGQDLEDQSLYDFRDALMEWHA